MGKTWKDFDGETEGKMFNSVEQDSTPLGPHMVATSVPRYPDYTSETNVFHFRIWTLYESCFPEVIIK